MKDMMIGVELTKYVFSYMVTFERGEFSSVRNSRKQFSEFMAEQPSSMVIFETCGGAHYWGRVMEELGNEIKLIAQ